MNIETDGREVEKLSPEGYLAQFASSDISPDGRKVALTALITAKLLPKQADHPAILSGRRYLLEACVAGAEPLTQLTAIAEIIRLGQVVKRWMPEISKALQPVLESEIPPLQLLPDADDRLNVARALSQSNSDWIPGYLSRSISEEDTGEKARSELMSALLDHQQTIEEALRLLASDFQRLRVSTEAPGDTMARRLTRTLVVFRAALADSELDAGDELGKALYGFIALPLSSSGRPQDDKARLDLVTQVILTVHDIVRSRISVAADPDVYRVVGYCRQLFETRSWPDGLRKDLDRLVTDVCEALVLLGLQGQCNTTLLEQLEILTNHRERARSISRSLSAKHPQLAEDVRFWLENWKKAPSKSISDSLAEQLLGNSDASVGLALQASRSVRASGELLSERLLSNLETFEPSLLPATSSLFDQIKVLAVQLEQLATLRSLDLFGSVGEEIDYMPKYFDCLGPTTKSRVVVKQPAVIKKRDDQTIGDVVLKGIVE